MSLYHPPNEKFACLLYELVSKYNIQLIRLCYSIYLRVKKICKNTGMYLAIIFYEGRLKSSEPDQEPGATEP